jgi:hypothetical protein
MSFTSTSISAANVYSLSASYLYDDKINLNPLLYNYDNGYSFYHHNIFNGTKDLRFTNESFFAITSSVSIENILDDTVYIDPTNLVIYTALQASNGKYISNVNNTLYAISDTIGASEFFRITRTTEGNFTISQNNLYATVVTDNNIFNITLQEKLTPDTDNIQKFVFYADGSSDTFIIKTLFKMDNWATYDSNLSTIDRFLSYYDGDASNVIKSVGMIVDSHYVDENNYKFTVTNDLNMFAIGFDGKIKWVKYYNELLNKFFNKTVDIKEVISDVTNNYLVEYPYKTKIDLGTNRTGTMKLNLLGLKNVMTPEYAYGVKKE